MSLRKEVISITLNSIFYSFQNLPISLPDTLLDTYIPGKLITANKHNAIYALSSKKNNRKYVLKILSKDYYNKYLYSRIFSIQNNFLLLPIDTFYDSFYIYFVMPYYDTLSYIIYAKGLSYDILKNLIIDIGQAILSLHQNGILHLDIAPQNIYVDQQNHFYLGDFSSSCLLKNFNLYHKYHFDRCLRTGTTPSFAPPANMQKYFMSYWQDQYSFSLLLYMLLNNGSTPLDDHIQETILFSNINQILINAMKPPQKKYSDFKILMNDLKTSFTICDQHTDCQNFLLKFNDTMVPFLEDTTSDINLSKNKRIYKENLFSGNHHKVLSIPIPFCGLLIICGLIFLLSIYHFISSRQAVTFQSNHTEFLAKTSSLGAITPSASSNSGSSSIKDFATNSPIVNPTPIVKNSLNASSSSNTSTSVSYKTILDISGLSYNDDSFFDKEENISDLKILFANNNVFHNCKAFHTLSTLEELYLNDNAMTSLNGILKLSKLKVLVLSKNDLQDISDLSKLSSLTTIDLSHNTHLTKINALSKLTHLQYLILTNTNITKKEVLKLQKKLPLCTILY